MPKPQSTGTFTQIVYSPKGGVEGMLLEVQGRTVQFVLAKDDDAGALLVASIEPGQAVTVNAEPMPPSGKGEGVHPVHALRKIVSIDGKTPKKAAARPAGYAGRIVRLNYARHGAPNGFVLDSGDFVHVKPEGFAKLGLKIGDAVTADGDAHFLSTGGGWAVEATKVNRKAIG